MSERIRRINKEYSRTSWRRWPFFLWAGGAVVVLGWSIWFLKTSLDRTASIPISDKNLLAVICRENECYWINKEGWAFIQGGKLSGNIILDLTDKTSRELKIGAQLIKPETLAELLFLRNRLIEEMNIVLTGVETQNSNLADFDFTTAEGWQLKLSTSDNAYKILEILKQSLVEIKKSGPPARLDYIDLRIPNKVYYKFR